MQNIWTIAKKEYMSFFHSAIAYIIGVVVFLSLGIYFYIMLSYGLQYQSYVPEIENLMEWIVFPLFFISVPVLTMRTIADENRNGTLELILTAPVRDAELVIGKWLGTYLFFLTIVGISVIYPIVLNFMVSPGIDLQKLIAVYLGVCLITAAMTAIGVCISAICKNPIVSLIASLGVIIILWIISSPAQYMTGFFSTLCTYLSLYDHFENSFYLGTIDLTDTIYFLSFTVFPLFLGTRVIEARRWK
jgi:ABC-2 type transport system permease protein